MGSRKKRIQPARKKEIANELQEEFKFSERHVCRLLNINRTFKRYIPAKNEENEAITKRLGELAVVGNASAISVSIYFFVEKDLISIISEHIGYTKKLV